MLRSLRTRALGAGLVLAALVACTTTGGGGATSTSAGSSGGPTGASAGPSSSAPAQRGFVEIVDRVLITRGAGVTPTCGPTPVVDQPAKFGERVAAKPGTRVAVGSPINLAITICPGVLDPAGGTATEDAIRYRIWLENNMGRSINSISLGAEYVPTGTVSLSRPAKKLTNADVLSGETATWEVTHLIPKQGSFDVFTSLITPTVTFAARDGLITGAAPAITLPPATPMTTTPTITFSGPAQATRGPGGSYTGPAELFTPACQGKSVPPVTIPALETSSPHVQMGATVVHELYGSWTLCDEGAHQAGSAAYPTGELTYRRLSAVYIASANRSMTPGGSFNQVTTGDGALVPNSGLVVEPGVPYPPRTEIEGLMGASWTFVVAYPKTGGPYFLRTLTTGGPIYALP
ncbi:MAG TPA: hypothetical protein P5181_10990 [Dermatophilaceae bacterium]|nr:hypothetical protein [Dermatophilaceae bacterium]